jgi:hypothetical protein
MLQGLAGNFLRLGLCSQSERQSWPRYFCGGKG